MDKPSLPDLSKELDEPELKDARAVVEPPKNGHMPRHICESVARMVASGHPLATVAAAVGRTPAGIQKALYQNKTLRECLDQARGEIIRHTSLHHYEMLALLPEARDAVESGLRSEDQRLKVDTAKWLHETLLPRPVQRSEVDLNLSGEVTQNHDVSGVLEGISKSLTALAEAQANQPGFLSRVKSGPAALPRVVPEDPEPPPTDPPDSAA